MEASELGRAPQLDVREKVEKGAGKRRKKASLDRAESLEVFGNAARSDAGERTKAGKRGMVS